MELSIHGPIKLTINVKHILSFKRNLYSIIIFLINFFRWY